MRSLTSGGEEEGGGQTWRFPNELWARKVSAVRSGNGALWKCRKLTMFLSSFWRFVEGVCGMLDRDVEILVIRDGGASRLECAQCFEIGSSSREG